MSTLTAHTGAVYEVTLCDFTQGSLCPSPMKIGSKYVDTVTYFAKKNFQPKVIDPWWPLTPQVLYWGKHDSVTSTQGSLCPSPWKYIKGMWEDSEPYLLKLEPKVIDP